MGDKTIPRWRLLGRLRNSGEAPPARAAGGPEAPGPARRQDLVDRLALEIAKSERSGVPVSLAIVESVGFGEDADGVELLPPETALAHLDGVLGRVAWGGDYVTVLEGGRFAVVLAGCGGDHAAAFGRRVSLAAGNRPLTAARLVMTVTMDAIEYSRARHHGPEAFLEAATGDGPSEFMPSPSAYAELRRARGADPHELRRQLGLKAPAAAEKAQGRLARGVRA